MPFGRSSPFSQEIIQHLTSLLLPKSESAQSWQYLQLLFEDSSSLANSNSRFVAESVRHQLREIGEIGCGLGGPEKEIAPTAWA
ncbi:hypothetical protein CEXT_170171 [Caerostris extrusa]|uniref:Uncharacterized protein n=1 Tax=Caerostris extrusa TaxID=172846 RepID=A0AAV4M4T2_CAEEX|nr:hypothetical protein CEXT_170171 [Caerostris extrusa]